MYIISNRQHKALAMNTNPAPCSLPEPRFLLCRYLKRAEISSRGRKQRSLIGVVSSRWIACKAESF